MARKVHFHTLGCKVNQNETEALASILQAHGYLLAVEDEVADIYILNTCTVTHLADRKSRQFIRRAVKANPQAQVIVMGCYAQVAPEEVAQIPGVSLVLGTSQRARIIEWLEGQITGAQINGGPQSADVPAVSWVTDIHHQYQFEELETPTSRGSALHRARALLKVQEGCQQYCSYCIIPYARGPLRSRLLSHALHEARAFIQAGFKEIVLTGIHLGAYGYDLPGHLRLSDLLKELLELSSEVRWRISSLEPTEVNSDIIELFKTYPNLCRHLHLPLQSGHNEILQAMNRPYRIEDYRAVIQTLRESLPDICISTDVMVGFPGETKEHFTAYQAFVEEMGFGRLHVFQYSPRRGTPAAGFPHQVAPQDKEWRSQHMITLGEKLAAAYARKFIGQKLQVLTETAHERVDGPWVGHSDNYLEIRFTSSAHKEKGSFALVKLVEVKGCQCLGEEVQD